MVYWFIDLAKYTLNWEKAAEDEMTDDTLQALLTQQGRSKLKKKTGLETGLVPGEDYTIKEMWPANGTWATLPDTKATASWRHDWIFKRRNRPADPNFAS